MDKYLLQILHEINTIIIPDLGALTITNAATGEIMFMSYLKYDDGKLWKHIAEKEGIEENDAKNLIAKYVREIKLKLDQGETYDMYQFGRFFKNNDGDVDFLNWSEIKSGNINETSENQPVEEVEELPENKEEIIPTVTEDLIPETESLEDMKVESIDELQNLDLLVQDEETKVELDLQAQVTPVLTNDLDSMLKAAESETIQQKEEEIIEDKTDIKVEEIVSNTNEHIDESENVAQSIIEENKEEQIEEVLKEKLEKSKTENIYLTPEEVTTIENLKILVPVENKSENKLEEQAVQKKKKGAGYWLLMIVGMLVIFGGTFAFVFYEEFAGEKSNEKTEKTQSQDPEEYLDEIISEENSEVSEETTLEERSDVPTPEFNDASKKTEKETPSEPVNTQTNSNSTSKTTTQTNPVVNGNFHVIVGSFGVEENARKLAKKLSSEGKNASVIGPKNGMYLVSAGSFATQAEAASEMTSIGNAWILKK